MINIRRGTQSLIKTLKSGSESIDRTVNNVSVKIQAKTQGTILEKWMSYWKMVVRDYKDVAVDVVKDMREKPAKATVIFSTIGLATFCAKHNPDETHFRNSFVKASNDLILVHPSLQNKETADHLKMIEQCYNTQILRYMNLGVCSIIWIDKYSKPCKSFEAQCPYLQLEYDKFFSQIIDIGFFDTWWILAKRMTDYDINYA